MEKKYVIGVDLGGTKILAAVSTLDGEIICQNEIPTDAFEGDIAVLNRVIKNIETVIKKTGIAIEEVKAIGIGAPGPLNGEKGIIIETPNLPFNNFQLVKPIEEKFNVKTYLDNDANAAAIAEYMLGAGQGSKNMVFITVSTGIGGGAIFNGKVFRGNTSNALEVGHMTIDKDGPSCGCGNKGCAEALASGTAIGKRGQEAVDKGLETALSKYDKVTSKEVFVEASNGDKVAKEILDSCLTYLGICVGNVLVSFDPDTIVIGGGVTKGGDIVFNKINEVVKERCFASLVEGCKIIPAGLGTDAGIKGAISLAILESK